MKRTQPNKLTRLSPEVISIYQNVRLAESFNGIDPSNPSERGAFIREWVSNKPEMTHFERAFFHEQLVVKQKSFMLRWLKLEERIRNMSQIAHKWSGYDDAQRLEYLCRDLEAAGYYARSKNDADVTLSGEGARRVRQLGLLTIATSEWKNIQDGWIVAADGLVISVQCPSPGPYIAIVDAIQIAGFKVEHQDRFKAASILSIRVQSTKHSVFVKLLENITFPACLQES